MVFVQRLVNSGAEPRKSKMLYCPRCAQQVSEPLTCGDCSAVICRVCGTPLETADELGIADIVEDVFLTAFDRFDHWSSEVPPGDWLESLIDPVIRQLLAHTQSHGRPSLEAALAHAV